MIARKGLGKGMGTGYKNIIKSDKIVHSQSAKGMRQTVSIYPLTKNERQIIMERVAQSGLKGIKALEYAEILSHNYVIGAKPDEKTILKFYYTAFPYKIKEAKEAFDESYFREWVGRFESPRRVWSFSDYDRRKVLKEMFPEKFSGLDKDVNLNNPEYMIKKYDDW